MDDDFRVRFCTEDVTVLFQLALEFMEVVDFAVEDHPNGFFGVGHGLMSAGKINDRKPAEAEAKWPIEKISFIVGTTMGDGLGHSLDARAPNSRQALEVKLSANPAHGDFLVYRFRFDKLILRRALAAMERLGFVRKQKGEAAKQL